MNAIGSEFNPIFEKMDHEDCFGFHSEYYIDPEWRKTGKDIGSGYNWRHLRRGYTQYSKYQDDIYFMAGVDSIVKSNVTQKASCAIKLDTKRSFDSHIYIAVNRRGYFLYDTQMITLFGFDGHEIYTHKFGQKKCVECVYIYDDKVIYSETKQTAISTKIYCVNMLTQEKHLVWGSQKGDSVLDNHLWESYRQEWGTELPFSQAPSNIGNVSCQFLYANKHRVVAGYTKSDKNQISYIVHIDLAKNQWSILDCFARPSWNAKESKYPLPSWDDRHIFSFNMIDDTMWVKTNDTDIRLVHTDIQRVAQLQGKYSVGWKLCALTDCGNGAKYYYFDGKVACVPAKCEEYCLAQNGEKKEINSHRYDNLNLDFWCFDGIYLVPNEFNSHVCRNVAKKYPKGIDEIEYEVNRWDIEKLVQNAKQPQLETAAESRKEESSGYTEPVRFADDDRVILAKAKKAVDDALSMDSSGYHYSEDQIESLVQTACELIRQQMHETTSGDEVPGHKEKEDGRGVVDGSQLSLAVFRQNAPSMTGFREQLLSYRKSLPNNWDYNAFVGILLGVGGPKHGDAACINFAIGQGDNGKNTRKTLEAKGLMPVFEKYKGRKIDETILLSDVENEIIAVAPEYAPIRNKLHEILKG